MITKDQVQKALGALEDHLPETVAKGGEGGDLGDPEGAAGGGGDNDSLRAPGEKLSAKAPKGKTEKSSVKKGEFPPAKHAEPDGDEGDEEEGDGDEDDGDEDDAPPAKAKKSMPSDYYRGLPSEVTTKVEVSNFLRSLVDHTADSVDGLRDYIAKSDMANENRFDQIESMVEGIQKSQGALGIVLRAICERIGVIENQPARVAKSQTAAPTAQGAPVQRSFATTEPTQVEGGGGSMFKSLDGKPAHIAKAMVSEVLCDLVRKGEAKDTDVINFETFNFVPPELQPKLAAALN